MKDLDLSATDAFRVQLWDVFPRKAEIESLGGIEASPQGCFED